MRKLSALLSFLLLLTCHFASAQFSPVKNIATDSSSQNTIDIYYSFIKENSHLYNGSRYPGYDPALIGHPFLDTTVLENGAVFYEGVFYDNIKLQYDINSEAVIVNNYTQNYLIALVNEKVQNFSIVGKKFLRLVPDSAYRSFMDIGFYEIAYEGKIQLLIKRKKVIRQDPITGDEIKSRYVEIDQFYIKKKNIFFQVASKKTLFEILKEKAKDIRKALRAGKIKFNKNSESAILQSVKYYDQLTN
jgi:hypothetical protein